MIPFRIRLMDALNRSNITQMALAEKLGLHRTVVNSWAKSRSTPKDLGIIEKAARIMNVSPAWLAGFDVENISDSESDMLRKFRSLSEANKGLILSTIEALLPETEKNQNLKTA